MDGLILTRNLPKHGLSPDRALSEFSQNRQNPLSLKENLKQESFLYAREYLLDCFDFRELVWQLKDHIETYDKQENRSAKQKHKEWAEPLLPGINSLKETSGKFQNQISKMTSDPVSADTGKLAERVKAAIEYFDPLLNAESAKIQLQIKSLGTAKGVKKYVTELKDIDSVYVKKIKQFAKSLVLVSACRDGVEFDVQEMDKKHMEMKVERNKAIGDSDIPSPDTEKKQKKKGSKSTKRPTIEVSFELYKSGKNVEEIAEERGLAHTTISTHLSQCVAKGLLPVGDFISPEKMEVVIKAYQEVKSTKLTDVKAVLGGEYSYEDVRFALAGFFANSEEKKDA
jgi:predicted transcriptional regulator